MSKAILPNEYDRWRERRTTNAADFEYSRDVADRRRNLSDLKIWIVIPMFRVRGAIENVLMKIPDWVEGVIAVDDKCPENSGDFVESLNYARVAVIRHESNQGVGGAVLTGYREAIRNGARIIVKVDGDDQMDLRWLGPLIMPIAAGQADYTKGNRFSSVSHVKGMPALRVIGNSALSLASKISSGYWNIFDPTNGFTAIEARVAGEILTRQVSKRYFFESDMLYHLGSLRAVVRDIPMPAIYGAEESNLRIGRILIPFAFYHLRNSLKRFLGQYLVRNFTVATLETLFGIALILFGAGVAILHFATRAAPADIASPGIVMMSALPIILGAQLLLAAINFDVLNIPTEPIHPQLHALDAFRFVAEHSHSTAENKELSASAGHP